MKRAWILLVLAACGGSTGQPTIKDVCYEQEAAVCARVHACEPALSLSECLAATEGECCSQNACGAVYFAKTTYDIDSCVSALAVFPCASLASDVPSTCPFSQNGKLR